MWLKAKVDWETPYGAVPLKKRRETHIKPIVCSLRRYYTRLKALSFLRFYCDFATVQRR